MAFPCSTSRTSRLPQRRRSGLPLLLLLAGMLAAAVPEPEGFRLDDYRAPVPSTVAGARVVSLDEVHGMVEQGRPC